MADYVREGLRIKLQRIAGITDDGVLDQPYYFQLPPKDEFSTEHSFTHNVYETLKAGQHSRRGGVELRRSSWNSLVVDSGIDARGMPTPGFVILAAPPNVEDLTAELIDLCESGSPFLYTAAHALPPGAIRNWSRTLAGPEAQWSAVLTRVRISQVAGEGDARYFDLDFVEYKDPVVGRAKLGRKKGGGGGSGNIKFPAHATVRADGFAYDAAGKRIGSGPATLSLLARHYYKDPSMASVIARANNLRGGSNDNIVWGINGKGGLVHLTGKAVKKLTIPKLAVAHI